ncbi:MAG: 50S ribosomal protein L29 [Candidatus Midichloria mitochondrii]|uniref:Large ribosomal subunit protein uL29 n=1 Tax=Midichloria mitochondrii (strain IricVA) TaxID=696127 RepID=F7XUK8_MIDMI|nr:50S ribosomal protein L29 [Candidatus Midichloria mitochondrii]AEI88357.1 ribosomal protein L29 [Candidatus Midichloria mitochondrii IricVA]MDJ1256353.1 50S ribosomal protein L29 [Candidatus Midichloria mitochondrii]MDJ1288059.1 50S ribosomal protein L29 [Candidatus Midichloria mitochondrii]MDJ1298897.1 50S ribosomal protein L29 [Candidatus Midichloria mitochondrii]MDJ1313113.1 50S ribosomal protein L29 [Candidatus Midichloria mitochondrii]
MKAKDLRGMSEKELIDQLISFKKESMNLRFRKTSAELTDNSKIRAARRNIARINTVIVEKRSAAKHSS